ncbi:triose-phosphate isomerase family protein [Flaviflexus massiliensis]|uniref:triose-phosphate isomerase family protein n=1 Tax=Flaviflexus massiliensis TaxID=1522309 RepID=UPI0006D5B0F4|nr:triose-phosphate isomerase family protein [Flaviflexus massiliensis]
MSLPSPVAGFSSKAYQSVAEAKAWADVVREALGDGRGTGHYICVPHPILPLMRTWLEGTGMDVGVQDLSRFTPGPHTGDVTAELLAGLGCRYVMLGHPERRRDYGETWELVAEKAARASENGIVPIIIAGEANRDDDIRAVVSEQLGYILGAISPEADLLIAYEPAWAIGVADAAPPEHVVGAIAIVNDLLSSRPGSSRIVYGGSAKSGTYAAIVKAGQGNPAGVPDGVFLGRAGLDPHTFLDSVAEVENSQHQ